MRRVGRPGLIGTMGRTAVVVGTATAVSGTMRRAASGKQQAAAAAPAAPAVPVPAAAASAAPATEADDPVAKLKDLAELKASGMLSEEEFAAMKAKVLGG